MRPLKEGGTQADAFRSWKRQTGKDHPESRPPVEPPSSVLYLWTWFWEINTGRQVSGMGVPMLLAPSEIFAWCQLRRVRLEDWELSVLHGLDAAFIKATSRKTE